MTSHVWKAALALAGAVLVAPSIAHTMPDGAPAAILTAASLEADRLIAATHAPALFENVSSDGLARVRHKASGLVCSFLPGQSSNTLVVYPPGRLPFGDDVGCNADFGKVYLTYYATRYGAGYSAQDSTRDAVAAIRERFADARPYDGETRASLSAPASVGELAWAAFYVGPEEATRYTEVTSAKVGEWIFKQRMSIDVDDTAGLVMGAQAGAASFFGDVLNAATQPR